MLRALLTILPSAVTLVAALLRPLRQVTMAACIATTLVLRGYVVHLTQA